LTEWACGAGSLANFLCLSRSVNIHLHYMCHVGQCLVCSPESVLSMPVDVFPFFVSHHACSTGFSFLLINVDCDGQVTYFFNFYFIILPRKSVYKTVSGVIDPQIRPLSSSASKHSPRRNRQVIINTTEVKRWKSCIRHIVKIVSCRTEVSMTTWLSFVDETLHVEHQ